MLASVVLICSSSVKPLVSVSIETVILVVEYDNTRERHDDDDDKFVLVVQNTSWLFE